MENFNFITRKRNSQVWIKTPLEVERCLLSKPAKNWNGAYVTSPDYNSDSYNPEANGSSDRRPVGWLVDWCGINSIFKTTTTTTGKYKVDGKIAPKWHSCP